MSSLYELQNDYAVLLDMLEDPTISEEAVLNTMELVGGEVEEKLINYAKIIKSIEGTYDPINKEKERLDNMKKSRNNKVKRMKAAMESMMLTIGKDKIKTDLFIFSMQKNPPSLSIETEKNIPEEYYIKQKPELDKKTLAKDIKGGLKIDGVEITQKKSLRIK